MAIPIPKTLLVGLGGYGKATLRAFRRKIYETYGCINIPALEYLILDTDRDPQATTYKNAYDSIDRHVAFSPVRPGGEGEFVDLSCDASVLDDLYQGKIAPEVMEALKWFNPRLKVLKSKVLEVGASGIRSFGKLAFLLTLLHGERALSEAIQDKLLKLHNLSGPPTPEWDDVSDQFTLDDATRKIDIFFFCSTAGGTGSGIFLDLAYFIRGLFQDKGIDAAGTAEINEIYLYLFLPDIILEDPNARRTFRPPEFFKVDRSLTPQQLVKAGSYAALSELEHYQLSQSTGFSFSRGWEGVDYFIPDWKPLKDPFSPKKEPNNQFAGRAPFDWTYLVGNRTKNGISLEGSEDAIEMTADKLFLLFVERTQSKLIETYRGNKHLFVLPDTLRTGDGTNKKAYARQYGGYGLSKVFIGEPRIHRWAAFYLAERFLTSILAGPEIPAPEVSLEVKTLWDKHGWNISRLFQRLSGNMLDKVRAIFNNTKSSAEFFRTVHSGVDFNPDSACYGAVSEIEVEYGSRLDEFLSDDTQNDIDELIEQWIVNRGLRPALQFLDSMISRAEDESKEIESNLSESVVMPMDFSRECQESISTQRNKLDWLGSVNVPSTPDRLSGIFVTALKALEHFQEFPQIPKSFADKIDLHLRKRFNDSFLADRCCQTWRDQLTQQDQIQRIQDALDELQRGVADMFKEVLKRLHSFQEELIKKLEEKRASIGDRKRSAAVGTLERTIRDILSREDKEGHQVGLRVELKDLSRAQDKQSRNIYCGALYQTPDALKEPNPSPELMLQTLKEGYGPPKQGGGYEPIDRIWDLTHLGNLSAGIPQWTSILIERGETELTVDPTLKDYYDSMGNRRTEKFREDISHCLKTSESYLGYSVDKYGESQHVGRTQFVFTPGDIYTETDDLFKLLNKGYEISRYQGKELIMLTIEDGVPLPLLDIMGDLDSKHRTFSWKDALWTRGEDRFEILSSPQATDVEIEIYIGLLMGTIWYDRATKDYKMVLVRKGVDGVDREIPIGKSISKVGSFFFTSTADRFNDPFGHLRSVNLDLLNDRAVLRKLLPLILYYEKYFFKENVKDGDVGDTSNRLVIEELKRRREITFDQLMLSNEETVALNLESDELCAWLHAFCEIVPVHETVEPAGSDPDCFPVLMRSWNQENSRLSLYWHNAVNSPDKERDQDLRGGKSYKHAMDANTGSFLQGKDLRGWDETTPTNIPSHIAKLAWGDPPGSQDISGEKDSHGGGDVDDGREKMLEEESPPADEGWD